MLPESTTGGEPNSTPTNGKFWLDGVPPENVEIFDPNSPAIRPLDSCAEGLPKFGTPDAKLKGGVTKLSCDVLETCGYPTGDWLNPYRTSEEALLVELSACTLMGAVTFGAVTALCVVTCCSLGNLLSGGEEALLGLPIDELFAAFLALVFAIACSESLLLSGRPSGGSFNSTRICRRASHSVAPGQFCHASVMTFSADP